MGRFKALTSRICPPERTRAADLGIMTLRLGAGGLIAGHGAQKLFGAFGGHGLAGTGQFFDLLRLPHRAVEPSPAYCDPRPQEEPCRRAEENIPDRLRAAGWSRSGCGRAKHGPRWPGCPSSAAGR